MSLGLRTSGCNDQGSAFGTPRLERASLCRELDASGAVPGWIQLLPYGPAVEGRDGRAWTLSDPASVASAFSGDIPLDWEHSTELQAPKGEPAPAAGWIKELVAVANQETRPDGTTLGPGVWGRVDWTPRGADSVRTQEYRFISPVFTHATDGQIRQVVSAALTNRPNLDLTALNRAEGAPAETEPTKEPAMSELHKAVCARLELAADTAEAAVIVALNARLNDAEKKTSEAIERAANAEKAVAERDARDHEKAVKDVLDKAISEGRLTPAERATQVALCTRENFEVWKSAIDGRQKVLQEQKGKAPEGDNALTDDEKAMCRAARITEEQFIALRNERQKSAARATREV